jgi:acetyltransferase-like isoleucine patch superfamily enzyme
MINDTSKPLMFLGSNSNIHKIYELCETIGYQITGIIDNDYYGQGKYKDIPVVGVEEELDKFQDHQFICVTNWISGNTNDSIIIRNREKRNRQIDLLDQKNLSLATIVSPFAQVSKYTTIGQGTVIDAFCLVEPDVVIKDHVVMHTHSGVGHGSSIGRNCVLQRYAQITSNVQVEENVYMGLDSKVLRSNVIVADNTFISPGLMLLRGTQTNEEVSLVGKDLRKVYQQVEIT